MVPLIFVEFEQCALSPIETFFPIPTFGNISQPFATCEQNALSDEAIEAEGTEAPQEAELCDNGGLKRNCYDTLSYDECPSVDVDWQRGIGDLGLGLWGIESGLDGRLFWSGANNRLEAYPTG